MHSMLLQIECLTLCNERCTCNVSCSPESEVIRSSCYGTHWKLAATIRQWDSNRTRSPGSCQWDSTTQWHRWLHADNALLRVILLIRHDSYFLLLHLNFNTLIYTPFYMDWVKSRFSVYLTQRMWVELRLLSHGTHLVIINGIHKCKGLAPCFVVTDETH